MKHKNGIENVILQLQKKETKMGLSISATITRVTMKHRSICCSVFNWQKLPLCSANMVAKKEERKKEKRESGKMTGCSSKATILV
jgi:hypothetical protein